MNILSLNTSSGCCSVALQYHNHIEEIVANKLDRSTKLLSIIEQLLLNKSMLELDLLTFAAGPGSLTGLKIASCMVQALSLAYQIPIMKVSTLETLALIAYQQFGCEVIIPCIDAKMKQVYYGVYGFKELAISPDAKNLSSLSSMVNKSIPQQLHPDSIGTKAELLAIKAKYPNALLAVLQEDGEYLAKLFKSININNNNNNSDINCDIINSNNNDIHCDIINSNKNSNNNDINGHMTNMISMLQLQLIDMSAKDILKLADYRYQKYGIIFSDSNPIYLCSY
jgi:tRNA threonylcarbamoyl adenosine modification protein YeaZ